ncbi:hypothetical protein ACJX0J_019522, partial [Zea mays]
MWIIKMESFAPSHIYFIEIAFCAFIEILHLTTLVPYLDFCLQEGFSCGVPYDQSTHTLEGIFTVGLALIFSVRKIELGHSNKFSYVYNVIFEIPRVSIVLLGILFNLFLLSNASVV